MGCYFAGELELVGMKKKTQKRNHEQLGRLGLLLEEKGITQAKLIFDTGLSPQAIYNHVWNDDKPYRSDVLVILSQYLNVSTDFLLGLKEK